MSHMDERMAGEVVEEEASALLEGVAARGGRVEVKRMKARDFRWV